MHPLGCLTSESHSILCPLDKKICGPQGRFVRGDEEKSLHFSADRPASSQYFHRTVLAVALYLQIGVGNLNFSKRWLQTLR